MNEQRHHPPQPGADLRGPRWRQLSEAAFEAVFLSVDGICIDQNLAAERMFGYPREEAIGRPGIEWIVPEDRESVADNMRTGARGPYRVRALRRDGTSFPCEIQASVLDTPDGPIRVTALRDISEHERLREAEREHERMALVERVVGQVAHDFNNLLAPIHGYPDLILEDLPEGHPSVPMLHSIKRVASRLVGINQQLLTLCRRNYYEMVGLDLNELVRSVVDDLERPDDGVSVECRLDEQPVSLIGGDPPLRQLMNNLLQNAIDAVHTTPERRIVVRTEHHVDGDRVPLVRLIVEDSGVGLPPELRDQVFQPFFTTHREGQRHGAGLGLSVVASVVDDHGGRVLLADSPLGGVRVTVDFPAGQPEVAGAGTDREPDPAGQTVLIVDDDPLQREVIQRLLKRLGFEARAVGTAAAALTEVKARAPDLLVLDMVLGAGMDGATLYERILAERPGQRAVLVSGYAESARVGAARQLGAGPFLRKPVTLEALATATRQALVNDA